MEIKSCTVPIFILLALRERLYPVKVRGLTWPDRLDRAEASSMIHKARVCGLLVMKPEYLAFIDAALPSILDHRRGAGTFFPWGLLFCLDHRVGLPSDVFTLRSLRSSEFGLGFTGLGTTQTCEHQGTNDSLPTLESRHHPHDLRLGTGYAGK
ncbi:uncharacterized protein BT62DRAFT_1003035 [Guyanagaster necrorhizus]|uniref:Uncharacterized protein n=1 Tax=Guyanagaster necrorhizus TaxID=856835 RepID=A0A9P7VZI5_9AGAR|nr:uncharacterized protein BT62DRAFT_1003035 [Guyanagaster necrorhizus MCA 3950]KAG7449453.1 hypothetical protein BT62DRAFT_1003035 [Guyanagaster necrorhizus MCA 3950]